MIFKVISFVVGLMVGWIFGPFAVLPYAVGWCVAFLGTEPDESKGRIDL